MSVVDNVIVAVYYAIIRLYMCNYVVTCKCCCSIMSVGNKILTTVYACTINALQGNVK